MDAHFFSQIVLRVRKFYFLQFEINKKVWLDAVKSVTSKEEFIKGLVPTVITIRPVVRGAILDRGDVEVIHKAPHPQSHAKVTQVVGKRTRRGLEAGETVHASWLDVPPLIQRGDRVEAAVLRGGLEVRAPAVALQRGGAGEMIRLKIPTTGRVIHGRILSASRVEVIQ